MVLESRCKHSLDSAFHHDRHHLKAADFWIDAGATCEDPPLPPIELRKYQFFPVRVLLAG